jgi:hypothetical protein
MRKLLATAMCTGEVQSCFCVFRCEHLLALLKVRRRSFLVHKYTAGLFLTYMQQSFAGGMCPVLIHVGTPMLMLHKESL